MNRRPHLWSIVMAILAVLTFASGDLLAAPIKVACVGDSITHGFGISNPYPAQLQALLGTGYQVGNFGRSGSTALRQSDNPYWNSPEYNSSLQFAPNIVVIMLGTNDSKPSFWNATNFNSDYRDLIATYRALATNPEVYICLMPPYYMPNSWPNDFPNPAFIQNTVVPAVRNIASQTGAKLIDNNTPLLNNPQYFSDGIHPTAQGAGIIADRVGPKLTAPNESIVPTIALTAPAEGAVVSGNSVIISATASDEVGGSGLVGVQFKLDGTDIGAEDKTAPYSTNWNSTFAVNGSHVLSAVSRDAAGNTSTASVNITVQNASSIANGVYKIIARHSSKALQASGTSNGSQVQQKTATGSGSFKWNVQSVGGNVYNITGVASGRNLDVAGASTANGANLVIWTPGTGNNQKWVIQPVGGGYYTVTAVHSGKAMDVAGGSTANGAAVIQWTPSGDFNQQWFFQLQ